MFCLQHLYTNKYDTLLSSRQARKKGLLASYITWTKLCVIACIAVYNFNFVRTEMTDSKIR